MYHLFFIKPEKKNILHPIIHRHMSIGIFPISNSVPPIHFIKHLTPQFSKFQHKLQREENNRARRKRSETQHQ